MKYLYGASVQGIQNFIFQTNKLKEIVGASELVEQICTKEFKEFCSDHDVLISDKNFIIKAAGNIKYIFDSETDCAKIVRSFPKHIANLAPGLTISQAVVPICDAGLYDAIDRVESKLKAQRSKVGMPVESGFMGLNRDRRTGSVAYEEVPIKGEKPEYICEATHEKRKLADTAYKPERANQPPNLFSKISAKENVSEEKISFMMDEITSKPNKSWLAIIHADGNGLGILLQGLGKSLSENKKNNEEVKVAFATFSKQLDEATKAAAQYAFNKVITEDEELSKLIEEGKIRYPLRPVLLGGDDLTIIIRADLALDFAIEFLKQFEVQTADKFKFLEADYEVNGFEKGLTACAGIAFIKESYPFHYGVHLAEMLTAKAKKFSKKDTEGIPPSSLSFYKVQSSFIEDLKEIEAKTLTANVSKISFDYGPYLIHTDSKLPSIVDLKIKLDMLSEISEKKEDSKGISKLRKWVSELYRDGSNAEFMLKRMKQVDQDRKEPELPAWFYESILEPMEPSKETSRDDTPPTQKTIVYDLLQLHSLKY